MSIPSARLFLIGLVVLLGGCALFPSASAPVARPDLSEWLPFSLNGRISINHSGKRDSAGLRWTHRLQTDEMLLLTPLGQAAARIYSDNRRDARQATLDEGGRHYRADDVESLMEQVLGWHLPLSNLHHWVLGMAGSGSPAQIERTATGQIISLIQDGWEIRYLSYADTGPDSLPKRLQLNHEDLQVILLIDKWEWNPQ